MLYALLGAALCDLRCRFRTKMSGAPTRFVGRCPVRTAILCGALVGVFTSLLPMSPSLPPLVVAFLLGYSVEIFASRLDWQLEKLLCCPMMRAEYPSLP